MALLCVTLIVVAFILMTLVLVSWFGGRKGCASSGSSQGVVRSFKSRIANFFGRLKRKKKLNKMKRTGGSAATTSNKAAAEAIKAKVAAAKKLAEVKRHKKASADAAAAASASTAAAAEFARKQAEAFAAQKATAENAGRRRRRRKRGSRAEDGDSTLSERRRAVHWARDIEKRNAEASVETFLPASWRTGGGPSANEAFGLHEYGRYDPLLENLSNPERVRAAMNRSSVRSFVADRDVGINKQNSSFSSMLRGKTPAPRTSALPSPPVPDTSSYEYSR